MKAKKMRIAYDKIVDLYNKEERPVGKINCYTCSRCKKIEKYLFEDNGVTPMKMKCTGCGGTSQSSFNKDIVPDQAPGLIWFRPSYRQVKKFNYAQKHELVDFILNGGLIAKLVE
jgi:hypothetical protein